MSSIEKAARSIKTLKDEEWRTLAGLERASMTFGPADPRLVSRLAKLPADRVAFALDKLNQKGMVRKREVNYVLTQTALEVMALREYVKRNRIAALGAIIAKGKESDVYEAFTDEGGLLALKFFKLGRISFRDVRRKRFVDKTPIKNWITINYEAAKREFAALKKLQGLSDAFPRAEAHNRSTVLLEQLNGVRLSQMSELNDPGAVLRSILSAARVAYLKAGLINADLSEYNILTDGEKVWLIDWPQAVGTNHPNAGELLARDVRSVTRFFKRRFGITLDEVEALAYVTGRKESL